MKKLKIVLFLFFLLLITVLFYRSYSLDSQLNKNREITCGTILTINRSRGGSIIKYEFALNGKKIISSGKGCTDATRQNFERGGDKIFVVFDKEDPLNNQILED